MRHEVTAVAPALKPKPARTGASRRPPLQTTWDKACGLEWQFSYRGLQLIGRILCWATRNNGANPA